MMTTLTLENSIILTCLPSPPHLLCLAPQSPKQQRVVLDPGENQTHRLTSATGPLHCKSKLSPGITTKTSSSSPTSTTARSETREPWELEEVPKRWRCPGSPLRGSSLSRVVVVGVSRWGRSSRMSSCFDRTPLVIVSTCWRASWLWLRLDWKSCVHPIEVFQGGCPPALASAAAQLRP